MPHCIHNPSLGLVILGMGLLILNFNGVQVEAYFLRFWPAIFIYIGVYLILNFFLKNGVDNLPDRG